MPDLGMTMKHRDGSGPRLSDKRGVYPNCVAAVAPPSIEVSQRRELAPSTDVAGSGTSLFQRRSMIAPRAWRSRGQLDIRVCRWRFGDVRNAIQVSRSTRQAAGAARETSRHARFFGADFFNNNGRSSIALRMGTVETFDGFEAELRVSTARQRSPPHAEPQGELVIVADQRHDL